VVGQVVLVLELLLFADSVGRDAVHGSAGLLDLGECVAEPARFNGSTGCVRLRIEEEDRGLAPQRLQGHGFI
jgi:hypothetical protein